MSASSPIVLVGTLDDIVFAGRNQAYGAFQLRRSYKQHLGSALALTVAAAALLLLLPALLRYLSPALTVVPLLPTVDKGSEVIKVLIERPVVVPPAARVAAAAPAVTVRAHTEILTEIETRPTLAFTPKPTDLPQDNGPSGLVTGPSDNNLGGSRAKGPGGNGGSGPDSAAPATVAPALPVTYVEKMPEFAGGQEALRRYLQKHLRYPAAALANSISGKVYLTFVVGTDGEISEVTVIKDLGYGTGEAAARAVRDMPAWTPGMQNRHAVPVRFTLPISFQSE